MLARALVTSIAVATSGMIVSMSAQTGSDALSTADIESAIADGVNAGAPPYLLRFRSELPEGGHVSWGLGFGATVNTPYWRVRAEAHRTWQEEGRPLTVGEIPEGLVAPVIEIAVPDMHHREVHCAGPGEFAVVAVPVGLAAHRYASEAALPTWFRLHGPIRPLWLRHAEAAALEAAGVSLTLVGHDRDGIIVAYPLEYLRSDIEFWVLHENHDNGCHGPGPLGPLPLHVRPSELATWQ